MYTCDVDIDEEVKQISQSEPYIVVTGQPGHENAQFFIVCEQAVLLESKSIQDALVDMIATYYVFTLHIQSQYQESCFFFNMLFLVYKTNKRHLHTFPSSYITFQLYNRTHI